jgi:hypothetical protein
MNLPGYASILIQESSAKIYLERISEINDVKLIKNTPPIIFMIIRDSSLSGYRTGIILFYSEFQAIPARFRLHSQELYPFAHFRAFHTRP